MGTRRWLWNGSISMKGREGFGIRLFRQIFAVCRNDSVNMFSGTGSLGPMSANGIDCI